MRLYPRSQTPKLYPERGDRRSGRYTAKSQGNISAVDVQSPDPQRFPAFSAAEFMHAVMRPGDVLFIPAGCWHFVKGLSTSISVNFWF